MAATNNGKNRKMREPISNRKLSTREKIIVLEGSKLHGSLFPPWLSLPSPSDVLQGSKYEDDTPFHLSVRQAEIFKGWQSCSEIHGDPIDGFSPHSVGQVNDQKPLDLVQDVTTDCSVVASLCAIISRTERGFPDLFATVFNPWDQQKQKPSSSASGQYVFRFYFNGSYRRVVIDDRLPTSVSERKLHVFDRNNDRVIWPALVEKAYLKVRGGYDFPGSNSGTDVWILTGWIPEQFFLHRYGFTGASRL